MIPKPTKPMFIEVAGYRNGAKKRTADNGRPLSFALRCAYYRHNEPPQTSSPRPRCSVKLYRGWIVALAGTGINFLVGISYTWSIFARGLVQELGWTQAEAAMPYTVFLFCYAGGMIVAGRIQDRLGPRPVVTVGGILAGVAFIGGAFATRPLAMALVWGIMFGFGLASCFASLTPAAMKWFDPHRRGTVAGIVVAGIGLSAIVMSPLVHFLVQRSVNTAFVVSGTVLLIGTLLLSRFIDNPPDYVSRPAGTTDEPWYRIVGDWRFRSLWVMFLLGTSTGLTVSTHLDRIVSNQAQFEGGYIIVSLFALFNALGRPVGGVLSDRLGRIRAMTVALTFTATMLLILIMARNVWFLGTMVALIGLGYGTTYSTFPAATVTFFGERRFGLYYGLVFAAIGVGGVYPLIAGYLFDRFGNFALALFFPVLFAALAAALSVRLTRALRTVGAPQH